MRISQSLIREGVSEEWQMTICSACRRDRKGKATADEHRKIIRLCNEIGGKFSDGLHRFLSDKNVNHEYIRMYYGIPRNKLFAMKREFYKKWLK